MLDSALARFLGVAVKCGNKNMLVPLNNVRIVASVGQTIKRAVLQALW